METETKESDRIQRLRMLRAALLDVTANPEESRCSPSFVVSRLRGGPRTDPPTRGLYRAVGLAVGALVLDGWSLDEAVELVANIVDEGK